MSLDIYHPRMVKVLSDGMAQLAPTIARQQRALRHCVHPNGATMCGPQWSCCPYGRGIGTHWLGTLRPWDTSSKGCLIQGTE